MNSPSPKIGTWLSIGSPVVAELAALSGFDWVLLDLEHGCESEAALPDQLRAIRGTTTQAVVRVAGPFPDQIARVLDWGADGLMVPRVESPETAREIVAAACHAPRGRRGFSSTVPVTGYGLKPHPEACFLLAQIETRTGVAESGAIAAVDGIDGLFVGPSDLRHDLAHGGTEPAPTYDDCLRQVIEAARNSGKETGILLREATALAAHRDLGFSRIAIESDLSILRNAYREILR